MQGDHNLTANFYIYFFSYVKDYTALQQSLGMYKKKSERLEEEGRSDQEIRQH